MFPQTDFWEQTGLTDKYVRTLTIDPASGQIFAATELDDAFDGLFRSTDDGDNWSEIGIEVFSGPVKSILITASGLIFAGAETESELDSGVFRSEDDGANWSPINAGLDDTPVRQLVINMNGGIFAGTVHGVFRSSNNGDMWETTGFTGDVDLLVIDSSDHLFVGTELDTMFRSIDNGESWMPINAGLTDKTIWALGINPVTSHVFAMTGDGLFRSTNNGDNWVKNTDEFFAFSFAFNTSGDIFAGTGFEDKGVFRSLDDGDNWTQISSGLTSLNVLSLAINANGHIFAGTVDGGVFRSVSPTTSVEEITGEVPTSFSLQQNFPNPFNPSTTIQFSLPRTGYVTLKLYNALAEEVKTLVAKDLSAGKYKVEWNASGFASGVYFYRIEAGKFVETKRLTLLR